MNLVFLITGIFIGAFAMFFAVALGTSNEQPPIIIVNRLDHAFIPGESLN